MLKISKLLLIFIIASSAVACKSKPVPTDDPKLKAMIDSIVRVRVEKYVQEALSQQQSTVSASEYRRIARGEAERATGRAAQQRQSQEDAIMNAQR